MSLINQMLQELEQRKASASTQSHPELKQTAQPVQALAAPRKNKVLHYAILAALCAAGAYGMQWLSHPAMPHSQQTASVPSASGVITEANASVKPMAIATLSHATVTEPVVSEQATSFNASHLFAPSLERTLHVSASNGALATAQTLQDSRVPQPVAESKSAIKAMPVIVAALTSAMQSLPAQSSTANVADAPVLALANTNAKPKTTPLHAVEPKASVNKTMSPEQQATHMYQQAIAYLQQGRVAEAQDQLKSTLDAYPQHDDARQTLVGLLVDNKRHDEAMQVLKTGLEISPHHTGYAQALARLQLDAGMAEQALRTLEVNSVGVSQPQEYHALMAVVLQKVGQHSQAITHYQQALSNGAHAPAWFIGLGVSLQAEGRTQEAKQAYQQAQSSQLSPELALFVSQRLKQVQ